MNKLELHTVSVGLSPIEKVRKAWKEYLAGGGKLASSLLTTSAKTEKDNIGYFTRILYLQPSNESGVNLCTHAGDCAKVCLSESGHMAMETIRTERNGTKTARWKRTHYMLSEKQSFDIDLIAEIEKHQRYCMKRNIVPVIRLNGTSDIVWDRIIKRFPTIQFYDYTKDIERYNNWQNKKRKNKKRTNYHITFSADEKLTPHQFFSNHETGSCAVVFDPISFKEIVKHRQVEIGNKMVRIINGDKTDNRFLDPKGLGLVALKAKGRARKTGLRFVYHYGVGGMIY